MIAFAYIFLPNKICRCLQIFRLQWQYCRKKIKYNIPNAKDTGTKATGTKCAKKDLTRPKTQNALLKKKFKSSLFCTKRGFIKLLFR